MVKIDDVEQTRKKPIGGELIIPVAAVIFTLYYFSTILDSPWTAQVGAFFIGAILLALCVIFLIRQGVHLARREVVLSFRGFVNYSDISSGRLAVFALTVLYVLTIEYGGFTLTTFAFLFLSMLALTKGQRIGLVTVLALTITLSGYLLFIVAFDTRFPRGPFEELMQSVF